LESSRPKWTSYLRKSTFYHLLCTHIHLLHPSSQNKVETSGLWTKGTTATVLRSSELMENIEAESWETPYVCLPHEVNHYLQLGANNQKNGVKAASQEPLWRRFRTQCSTKVLLHDPEILSRERVHNFIFASLWQYIGRGAEENLRSSFSTFLTQRLRECDSLNCTGSAASTLRCTKQYTLQDLSA
jgi:hypothetical protein